MLETRPIVQRRLYGENGQGNMGYLEKTPFAFGESRAPHFRRFVTSNSEVSGQQIDDSFQGYSRGWKVYPFESLTSAYN